MAVSLGSAVVDVRADTRRMDQDVESGLTSAFKKAAVAASAAFAAIQIGRFIGDAVSQASDLNESINAIQVTLGEGADSFLEFGKTAATQLGLTQAALNEALVPSAALLKNAGSSGEILSTQLQQLATRATDVASIFNADVNEVLLAFNSALRGEQEPARRFGVNLNDIALRAKAVELGLAASTKEVSQAAKSQAAMALIMDQTSQTQGDFLNTSDQLANQMRILKAQFGEMKAELGTGLLQPINEVLNSINPLLTALTPLAVQIGETLGQAITALAPGFEVLASTLGEVLSAIQPALVPLAGAINSLVTALAPILPLVANVVSELVQAFAPALSLIFDAVGPLIQIFVDLINQVLPPLMEAIQPLIGALSAVFAVLAESLTPALAVLLPQLGDLLIALLPLIDPMVQILLALLPLIPPLVQLAATILNIVLPALTALTNVLVSVFNGVAGVGVAIVNKLVDLGNAILGVINDIVNKAIDAYNKIPFLGDKGKVDLSIPNVSASFAPITAASGAAAAAVAVDMNKIAIAPVEAVKAASPELAAASKAAGAKAAKSFSEAMKDVRKDLKALTKGIGQETVDDIRDEFKDLKIDLKGAGLKQFNEQITKAQRKVIALAKTRETIRGQLEDARDSLADLRAEAVDFNLSIRESVKSLGDVTKDSGGIRTTFNSIRGQLISTIRATAQFSAAIDNLRARGLNQDALRQLIEAGPQQGLQAAQALSRASNAQLAELNGLQASLSAQADRLGNTATSALYTAGLNAAKGLVAGLQAQDKELTAAMDKIADKLVASIKKKLKIKSPSGVFADEVGWQIPAGVVQGIRRGEGDVRSAIERLATINANSTFGPGSVQVNGVSDPEAARRAGIMAGLGITQVLEQRKAANELAGVS